MDSEDACSVVVQHRPVKYASLMDEEQLQQELLLESREAERMASSGTAAVHFLSLQQLLQQHNPQPSMTDTVVQIIFSC